MALYCLSINISSYLVQEVNLFEQSDEMYLEGGLNAKLKLYFERKKKKVIWMQETKVLKESAAQAR